MQGWPPASEDDRLKGEDMGKKERLAEYWRRLRSICHKADMASEVAIQKYGIPNKSHVAKEIPVQSTFQKVTRRGIKVNGREYWDDDLLLGYFGKMVNVVIALGEIRVEDADKKMITTFTPIQN